ncbi:MAG TPA: glycosyltransferase family 39 protein [Gemmataceae bacterium]|nr:glycosyltransferase family 39 protein [Gemmataceae bacterium]
MAFLNEAPGFPRRLDAPTGAIESAASLPQVGGAIKVPLLALLLAGAAVRLCLWFWFQHLPIEIVDEQDYNSLAKNLVEHGEFSYFPGTLTSIRPPLYPLLVAGVYTLFGLENFQAVRLIQAVMSLLNVVVLYGLGKEIASRRTALWLAGLFCFYPSFLGFNNLLLTETLFTLLLCTFCYLIILACKRQAMRYLLVAGVVLGLATLTRSILWMFPPVLALFLLICWQGSWPRRFVAVLAVVLPFALTMTPWAWRNTVLHKTFVPVDTMGGLNFMTGNYRHTPFYRSWDAIGIVGENSWYAEVFAAYPPSEYDTPGKIDKLALKQGLLFVRDNPLLTLQRDIIKFFDFWGLERELVAGAGRGIFGPLSGLVVVLLAVLIMGSYVAALFVGIFGLFLVPLGDRRTQYFLVLLVVYICGLHSLVFAHSRYHLPVMPLVLVFTATALTTRPTIWWQWRRGAFWLAAGLCILMVCGWIWGLAAGDMEKFRQSILAMI